MKRERVIFALQIAAPAAAVTLVATGLISPPESNPARAAWGIAVGAGVAVAALLLARGRQAAAAKAEQRLAALEKNVGAVEKSFQNVWAQLTSLDNGAKRRDAEAAKSKVAGRGIDDRFLEVTTRVDEIRRQLEDVVSTPTLWVTGIRDPHTRKQILHTIAQALRSVTQASSEPGEDLTDRKLQAIVSLVGTADVAECADPEVRALAQEVRRHAYDLSDANFPMTKASLRTSAEAMLEMSGGGVATLRTALGYAEVVAHADQWDLATLKRVERKLRAARAARGFSDLAGSIVGTDGRRGLSSGGHLAQPRLWKRVWPSDTEHELGKWGGLKCVGGNGCGGNGKGCVLNEVSLCGASCRTCTVSDTTRPVEMELHLPNMSEPIKILQARFRPHPDQFRGPGVRGEPGIGIEFIDISKEQMAQLARFIRTKEELEATRPPGNAPWLNKRATPPAEAPHGAAAAT